MLDTNINCFLFPKLITKATVTTINSERSLPEADSGGGAGDAHPSPPPAPYFIQSLNFFAVTLKNYKLSYSKLN